MGEVQERKRTRTGTSGIERTVKMTQNERIKAEMDAIMKAVAPKAEKKEEPKEEKKPAKKAEKK